MKCPKCNSNYTEAWKVYEDFEVKRSWCTCKSCSDPFIHEEKKQVPEGELLMELIGTGSTSDDERDDMARFYLTSQGTLTVVQKRTFTNQNAEFTTLRGTPKLLVCNFDYRGLYFIQLNSKFFSFRVGTIRLYGSLLEKAKASEAVSIITRGGALKDLHKSPDGLNDAVNWLNSALEAYPSANGGCYIATCVYGSYDCPEVWALRRFRDNTLGTTWYGRAFIRLYYAISPALVKWFGKTKWFQNIWRPTLDRMVRRLKANGVSDLPYQDQNW